MQIECNFFCLSLFTVISFVLRGTVRDFNSVIRLCPFSSDCARKIDKCKFGSIHLYLCSVGYDQSCLPVLLRTPESDPPRASSRIQETPPLTGRKLEQDQAGVLAGTPCWVEEEDGALNRPEDTHTRRHAHTHTRASITHPSPIQPSVPVLLLHLQPHKQNLRAESFPDCTKSGRISPAPQ